MTERHDGWILLVVQALLLGLAAGVAAQPAPADTPRSPDGVAVSAGFGPGSRDFGGQLSLWVTRGPHSMGVRTAAAFDFEIFSPSSSETDIALLYGRRGASGKTWGRVAVGPALVETVRPGEVIDCFLFFCSRAQSRERTFGLAFQTDGVWAFSRFLGLGLSVFGNLNPESSFAGAALSLHLGKVGA